MIRSIVASFVCHRIDVLPVAHDRDAVRDLGKLLEPMGDVDDAHPLVAQLADDAEEFLDFRLGERRRRLIHDEHLGVEGERLGDLDHLLFGNGQVSNFGAGSSFRCMEAKSAWVLALIFFSFSMKRTPWRGSAR